MFPLPPELNCSGTVSQISYCYEPITLNLPQIVLQLLILEQSGDNFTLLNSIDVQSTPTDSVCFDVDFCCDITTLAEKDRFQLPSPNFAFGTVSSSLWAIRSRVSEFRVEHYQFPLSVAAAPYMDLVNGGEVKQPCTEAAPV